ncbi:MAG: hypothetical protein IPJ85_12185 [Flavobacteriales bacterium]|nr:hypothetical protein [Flavobacteriales bacterium]
MSRFEKWMLALVAVLIVGFAALEATAPQPTDWSPSFSRYHHKPYGGKLVFERIKDIFPEARTMHDPVEVIGASRAWGDEIAAAPVNHAFINTLFGLDRLGTDYLLRMVEQGDHALIAAERFGDVLADTLNIVTDIAYWDNESVSDIRFVGERRLLPGVFRFGRGFPGAHFTRYDTARTRVLAVDGASRPVLLHMAWGEGRIVLCSAARAQQLQPGEGQERGVRRRRDEHPATTPFAVGRVLQDRPHGEQLPLALSLARTGLALGLVPRADPAGALRAGIRPPAAARHPHRATAEECEPRARPNRWPPLLAQSRSRRPCARKMIAHFKEEARARSYLRSFAFDEATTSHLAAKTGLTRDEMHARLQSIARMEAAERVSEKDLLDLSNALHELRQRIP